MDRELQCDFVFGDKYLDVKKMDYSLLQNFKKEVKNKVFIRKPLTFQKGVISQLKEDYDILLVLGDLHCISTWFLLLFAPLFKKKIYLWSHGWYGKESNLKAKIKKIFFNLADGTFLYGNYARDLMIRRGLNPIKLFVIYNSLSYDKHIELRSQLKETNIFKDHFDNQNKNLIFIGRLTKVKRLDILLEALSLLNNNNPCYNLTIIGEGEEMLKLIELARKLNIENYIWFYGACYEEFQISQLIYNADLCVSPGNVGLTAIHSMSFGTPVVTHNDFSFQMPEFESIEDGVSGSFFEYNDVHSLVKSIKNWFNRQQNRDVIRNDCFKIIDDKWNPYNQIKILKKYLK